MWNTELWGKRYKKSGRIGRLDYLKSQMFLFAVVMGLFVLSILTLSKMVAFITFVYGCIYLWLSFCLMAKRVHDVGLSSWILAGFILLVFRVTINSDAGVHTYSILGLIFGDKAGFVSLGLSVLLLAVLLGVKGRKSDNKYGKALE